VRLDITHKSKEFLESRFPTIYNKCLENGIDISKDPIPVGPVQHYMMGGVKTGLWGETNIRGLLACGEVASTGVHGANRLASNSTLECLVFGRRCAAVVNKDFDSSRYTADLPDAGQTHDTAISTNELIIDLKGIMIKHCGIVRDGNSLQYGINCANKILGEIADVRFKTVRQMELYNMTTVALSVLHAAFDRKHSVGAHYRIDEGSTNDDCKGSDQ
jgi:L-aspartate oxidase